MATDQAPFNKRQKDLGKGDFSKIPNGLPSVEDRFTLIYMNVDYSAFEGKAVRGLPEVVMQRGAILVEDGQFHGKVGQGQFVARSRFQAP